MPRNAVPYASWQTSSLEEVQGITTIKLIDMPWDEALEIILFSQGLVKNQKGKITYIKPAQ